MSEIFVLLLIAVQGGNLKLWWPATVILVILVQVSSLRGGQAFFFGTKTFEITYDQCTIVVCTTFKGILRLLGQIVFFGAIGVVFRPP